MKNSKKILAMILTLTMVFSFALSFTASADSDGDGSIMILDTQEGATYTAYKVLSLSYTGNGPVPGPTNYQYAVEAQFVPFFNTPEGAAFLLDTDPSGQLYALTGPTGFTGKFINVTETNKEDFANALYAWIAANKASLTHVASETADATGFIEWTGLDLGYYAVYPDFDDPQQVAGYGTLLSLNNSTPEARVNVKAKLPEDIKEVEDPSNDVGQYVNFTIKSQMPADKGQYDSYTDYFWGGKDVMTKGLTFDVNDMNLVVTIGTAPNTITVAKSAITVTALTAPENGFEMHFSIKNFKDRAGQPITITYRAKLNSDSIVQLTENEWTQKYGDDPNNWTWGIPTTTEVWTNKIIVNKYDPDLSQETTPEGKAADPAAKLAGAEFVLVKKVSGANDQFYAYDATADAVVWVNNLSNATRMTTDNLGKAEFGGLEDGTYYLREVYAPAGGYNVVDYDIECVVAGQKVTDPASPNYGKTIGVEYVSDVANYKGPGLPSTGGVGTTLFYIVGSMLLLGAVVLLVTRKRMGHEA